MLKRISFFLAIGYTITLAVVSLMNLKDMPEVEVRFADKIFHFLAYSILCVLWYLVCRYRLVQSSKKAITNAILFAIAFGIIIEVLQGTTTSYRSFDIYDAIANSLGAMLAGVVLIIKDKIAS